MKVIIESIRDCFDKCPLLSPNARLNLDYLGLDDIEYGIYSEPTNPLLKKYVDGDELKQYTFVFATKTLMSSSYVTQLDNIAFFDRLIEWIYKSVKDKKLPKLEGNRYAIDMEVLTNGYLIANDEGKAQYQIQMRLKYLEVRNGNR